MGEKVYNFLKTKNCVQLFEIHVFKLAFQMGPYFLKTKKNKKLNCGKEATVQLN